MAGLRGFKDLSIRMVQYNNWKIQAVSGW
jgi:hypothetical protein